VDEIWVKQLFTLDGDEWKQVRSAFSPIFTSGKLRHMLPLLQGIANQLVEEIEKFARSGEIFDAREVFGKYSMESIATCAFGVSADAFTDPNSAFVSNAKNVFCVGAREVLTGLCLLTPYGSKMLKMLGIAIWKPTETNFFIDTISRTIKERLDNFDAEKKIDSRDLLDLMIRVLKEEESKGGEDDDDDVHGNEQFERDSVLKIGKSGSKMEFDELTIKATALIMMIAGNFSFGLLS
jgi:cytochrome P450